MIEEMILFYYLLNEFYRKIDEHACKTFKEEMDRLYREGKLIECPEGIWTKAPDWYCEWIDRMNIEDAKS